MSKQLTMWCVFDEKGKPFVMSNYRNGLLQNVTGRCRPVTNKELEEDYGWKCRKVRVTIEEVKP